MMKFLKVSALFLIAVLLMIGCSSDSETVESDGVLNAQLEQPDPPVDPKDGLGNYEVSVNPNRGYYDVVVVDIDRWELCMNYNRIRLHVTSFTGHMWYQMGSFIFEGTLAAMYDPRLDLLTATALDSGWDRGHIVYSLEFQQTSEGGLTNDMLGGFVYFEYPRRTSWITAWLDQGILGPHDAGPWVPGPAGEAYVAPDYHPKRARIEAQMNEK
jgi:hypothetical protein